MDGYYFSEGVYAYFVTFTVVDWPPIFSYPEPREIIVESLRFCVDEKYLRLNAYVVMPSHIHMVVYDANFDNNRLKSTLTEFRKYTGHILANYID